MTEVEALNKTKNVLLERGWVQRSFENEDGSVCILGALNRCDSWNGHELMRVYIQLDMNKKLNGSVLSWNDDEGRTFNDIMEFLDEMILEYKEEASDRG